MYYVFTVRNPTFIKKNFRFNDVLCCNAKKTRESCSIIVPFAVVSKHRIKNNQESNDLFHNYKLAKLTGSMK